MTLTDPGAPRRAATIASPRASAVLEETDWPWELIDVEPLLEDGVTVLYYLGPHHLDAADIRARFRMTSDLDVVFEPVGADEEPAPADTGTATGCGSGGCGSGGCGSGGCGSQTAATSGGAASKASHGGCSSCGLRRKPRRRPRARCRLRVTDPAETQGQTANRQLAPAEDKGTELKLQAITHLV